MISFRPVTPHDLGLLQNWDRQPHVAGADPDGDWEWEKEVMRTPSWREQLIAELNHQPIGFLQIIDPAAEESGYWGKKPAGARAIDIWIGEAGHLNRGYGSEMMRLAIRRCFDQPGVNRILTDPLISNTRAHRFYERLGFVSKGPRVLGGEECLVYELKRK